MEQLPGKLQPEPFWHLTGPIVPLVHWQVWPPHWISQVPQVATALPLSVHVQADQGLHGP